MSIPLPNKKQKPQVVDKFFFEDDVEVVDEDFFSDEPPQKKSQLKNGSGNGINGLPQSTSQLPLQNGKEIFGFDKFSEFKKPEANPKRQQIPEWTPPVKPQSIAEAHTSDKAVAKNLFNELLYGIGNLTAGIADPMFQLLQKVTPSDPNISDEQALKNFREEGLPTIRTATQQLAGADVTPEQKKAFDENIITSSAGGLVRSIPAMVSPAGVGLFIQAYDSGLESINSTEEGAALPEKYKTIFGGTIGLAQGALERYGLNKIFGKQSGRVASNLAINTLRDLAKNAKVPITAEVFEQALNTATKTLKKKVINAGGKIAGAAAIEFETGTTQEASTVFTELATNKLTGKPIFDEASFGENFGRILYAGAQEAIGGGILGTASIPFSRTRNYIAEKVATAKSPEDIIRLKQELIGTAEAKEDLSDEEKIQFEKTIDDYVRVNQKIPSDIAQNRVEVSEKIIEREEIQNEVTKKLEEVTSVDDAFKPMVREEMEALKNRSEEINDEIKVLSGIEETATEEIAQPVELSTEVVEKNIAEELRGIKNFISSPNATDEEAISYAQDKVAEAPIEAKDKLGEELYNKVLEQTSTTKLQEGLDYLIKNNLDDPNVDVLDKIISEREKISEPVEDVKGVSSNQKNIEVESKVAEWFKEEPQEIKDGFKKFVEDILDNLAEQKGDELSVGFKFSGVEGHKQIDAESYLPEAKPLSEQARKNFSLQGRFYNNAIHVLNDMGFNFDPPSNWMQGNAKMVKPKTEPPLTVKEQEPIKDKEGNPITFYHGTPNKNVSELEPASAQQFGKGIYFAASKESVEDLGDGGKIFEVHLPDKLLEVGKDRIYSGIVNKIEEETGIDPASDKFPLEKVNDEVKKLGYKGLIMDNDTYGGTEAMVFDKKDVIYKDNKSEAPSTVKDKNEVAIIDQSKNVEDILGVSKEDADALSIIYNADLTPTEKNILYRQYKNGVMNLNDVKNYSGVLDVDKLNSEDIGKWARAALEKAKSKGNKKINAEDIDFEELPAAPSTVKDKGSGVVDENKLEQEYFHNELMRQATTGKEREQYEEKVNEIFPKIQDNEGMQDRHETFLKENVFKDATKTLDENLQKYADKFKEQSLSNTENKTVKDKQNEPTQKNETVKPETKIGKYEAKVKDFFENTEKKIPSWLINRDPNIKSQGIDLYDILKNASIEVGRLVDTGIELADAIKRGADKLIEDYKKGLGFNSKLKPEFEKQLREGFDNHYRENVLGEEATQNVDNEPPKPPVDDNETETEDEGNGKDKIDDAVSDITETGVVKKYLSGKTIEKYTGEEATNNQNYTATVLKDAFEQGENVIQVAKDVYGKEYVPKMLDYIANSNMSVSQKALLYVTLRNDLYQRRMEATDNNEYASIIKLQELAYSKSQAFAHENAVAMNMWKLQNLQKYGYNIDDTTSSFMSESEMEDRAKIEDAVQVDDDAVNKEADINEDAVVGNETTDFYEDVEKEKAAAKANKPVRKKSSKSKWKAAAADKGKLQDLIDNLKDKINKLNC